MTLMKMFVVAMQQWGSRCLDRNLDDDHDDHNEDEELMIIIISC